MNAQIVIRTGLPSFIVTLAFLFILRGLSLVGLKWATGGATQLRGVKEAVSGSYLAGLFSGDAFQGLFGWLTENGLIARFPNGEPTVKGMPVEVLWFVGIALVATYILVRTRFGNWILPRAVMHLRRVIPACRCAGSRPRCSCARPWPLRWWRSSRFSMRVGCAARLSEGIRSDHRGRYRGCLLTGGYGSAIGAFFGAIIFGMVLIGLTYTQIDQDWYLVFLGGMLLIAVLFNNFIRKRATGER